MTPTTFSYAGIDSTSIPELVVARVRRPLVAAIRDEYVTVPGREGFWLFAERAGARTITLELDLLAATYEARRAAVIALADLVDVAGPNWLIVSDEPDRFHRCRLASAPDPDEWLLHGSAVIDLTAEPYSQALIPTVVTYTALSGAPHSFAVDDRVYGVPEIEVTAAGGTVTNLTVTLNGVTLTYGSGGVGLAAGETLTASTLAYTVTRGHSTDAGLVGTFDPDLLDMATVSGDFAFIVPGTNTITASWSGTATTLTTTIRWRRRAR